jgi:hypothetical protein
MRYREFIESRLFTRLLENYLDDEEYSELQRHMLRNPKVGPVIRGSGGVRKLRWSVRGKGKSGGVRVIYYIPGGGAFWMLTIYGKGEVESISGPVLKKIKEAMQDGQA